MVTLDRLKECLEYNSSTGFFIWRVAQGTRSVGAPAGSPHKEGYIQIKIDRVLYKAHRLAWLYIYGQWPEGRVDHKNNVHSDNRIDNLRRATHSQNQANRKLNANSSTGLKGVHSKNGRYSASIAVRGRRMYLGTYGTPESAHAAYKAAAIKFHGEFARFA